MVDLVIFAVVPGMALFGSIAYTLTATLRLWDWRPVLFIGVLALMLVHQSNEVLVFFESGNAIAPTGFGEYPETTANLLASAATVFLLRFVQNERALSEQLREFADRLESRIRERTAELESFAYSVSHDLRPPLRAIDGYTRILRDEHGDELDEEGRRLVNAVCENARTMGTLIDDLLTLSRIGRREMDPKPLDMDALARDAYRELSRSRSGADGVQLDIGNLSGAVGDRPMVRHALTQLFSNAVKFTSGVEAPRIEVGSSPAEGRTVFFVRDNGVGFEMDYADKLFGVFERLHDEDEFEGTGIGLAIVERIIQRHDGRVWAEGSEGEGATIYFSLPTPEHGDE